VGDPPPNGITGFNSGVLLLNLDKMRKSDVYNSLIKPKVVKDLTEKFTFKGHLGDQDFSNSLNNSFMSLLNFRSASIMMILCNVSGITLCIAMERKNKDSL
jgi:hypothetical protein